MSISQFKNNLRNYIVKWGDENNQDINNEKSRGSAFEDFVLGVISDRYEYDNTSPLDNINRTNDCGFDIIIPPSGNANFYTVCQCEVGGYGKKTNASIDREKLKGWIELLSNLMDKTWIDDQKTISRTLRNELYDLKKHIEAFKSVKWLYVSNKALHPNSESDINTIKRKHNYDIIYQNVEMRVLSVNELSNIYTETQQVESVIPNSIKFMHGEGKSIFAKSGSHPFFVGLLPASTVIGWYKSDSEGIFSENIRTLLTKNRINTEMEATIKNDPENFRHYNNGVSAICETLGYDAKARTVSCTKFNIINGAQTVGTLHECRNENGIKDVEVLVRITQVKYASEFSSKITQFNNTQNVVAAPDFKSNDKIQLWLEKAFNDFSYPKHFSKISYRRKRPYNKGSGTVSLKITDFAKIRRSYIFSSSEQNSQPQQVWRNKSDGGCYEDIFPRSGILDADELNYFIFIYHVQLGISKRLEDEKDRGGEARKSLTRMVLLGIEAFDKFWKDNKTTIPNHIELEQGKEDLEPLIEKFWYPFYNALEKKYDAEIVNGNTTAYSFVRSKTITSEIVGDTLSNYKMILAASRSS